MSDEFDPYYKWLAIPPDEQPPHHYRLLGLRVFEPDEDVIDNAAEQRLTLLRSRQTGKHAALSQKLLNEISAARVVLLDPDKRRPYDERLQRELQERPVATPYAAPSSPAGEQPLAAPGAQPPGGPAPIDSAPRPHGAAPVPLESAEDGFGGDVGDVGVSLPTLPSGDPMQNVPLPYVDPPVPPAAAYYGARYGGPQYGAPGYAGPQPGAQRHEAPQYAAPPYGTPQYADPAYGAAPYENAPQQAGQPSGYTPPQFAARPSRVRRPVNRMVWVYAGVGVAAVLVLLVALPLALWLTSSDGGSVAEKTGQNRPRGSRNTSSSGQTSSGRSTPSTGRITRPGGPSTPAEPPDRSPAAPAQPTPRSTVGPLSADRALVADALVHYSFEPDTFERQAGPPRVQDQSGHGMRGILQGSPLPQPISTGAGRSALQFADGRGMVVIPGLRRELIKDRTELTVAVWMRSDRFQGSGYIFDVGWTGTECFALAIDEKDYRFTLATRQGGKLLTAPRGGSTAWHHLAAVWDGKEQRLYVDGRLAGRAATTLGSLNSRTISDEEARLGITAKNFNAADRYFAGEIDEFVVLPRALADADVEALYRQSEPGNTSPPAVQAANVGPASEVALPDEADDGLIDLLALIDLDQDARPREKWAMNGGKLECVRGSFVPKVIVPYEPPEEYDVKVVFSQPRLRNGVSIVMPKDGASFFWTVGGAQGQMAFSLNGSGVNQTSRREPGSVKAGQVHTTLVQVRNDGVIAWLDGEKVAEYQTDYSDMKTDSWRTIKEKKQIAICADDPTTFHTVVLAEIRGKGRYTRRPQGAPAVGVSPSGGEIDLLQQIDVPRDVVRGNFQLQNGALVVPAIRAAQLEIPLSLPPAYRLELEVEKLEGDDSLTVGLVCGDRQVMMVFDGFGHTVSGLNLLDGRSADRNATSHPGRIFSDNSPKTIVCSVHPGAIHVACDGQTIVDWKGDPVRLSLDQRYWRVRTQKRLIIGGWDTEFKITKLQLTPLAE